MRLLLDTHLLLWAAASSARLPREARELLQDDSNDVYYSAASIWEIAIKSSLRRKDFRIDLTRLLGILPEMGLIELPVRAPHAARVAELPLIHRDPFDRLLIAQSVTEPLTLLTNDTLLDRYRVGARIVL
ncbi:MAG: type II toxin-antitoxin system VapC family toxin [Deltaproteobacteria bacterium]|nr:type II toxin-antitoxin system VapC family toxin [Deltaproteobacteria bacterium]